MVKPLLLYMDKYRRSNNYINIGKNLYLNGNKKESLKSFQRSLTFENTKDSYIETYLNIAQIYYETNEYDNAIKIYETIIDKFGLIAESFYGIAVMYDYQNNYEKAKEYYLKAIEIDNNYRDALFYLADLYDRYNYEEESIIYYKEILKKFPDDYMAYNNIGSIYEQNGKFNDAIRFLEESIRINPSYFLSAFNLGIAYKGIGNNRMAKKYYLQALELNDKESNIYLNLSALYIEEEKYIESIEILNKGIDNVGNSADLFYNRSCVKLKLNLMDEAFVDLYEAIKINPSIIEYLELDPDFDDYRNNELYKRIIN